MPNLINFSTHNDKTIFNIEKGHWLGLVILIFKFINTLKSNGLYVNWKIAKPYMTMLVAQAAYECKANPTCTERGWGTQHHLAVHQQAWDWQ